MLDPRMSVCSFRRCCAVTLFLIALLGAGAPSVLARAMPSEPGLSAEAYVPRRSAPSKGTAVLNQNSGLTYPTIQDAVDAATAGDVLVVQAANHAEGQVVLSQDLTLRGATGGEIVRMAVDTGDTGDARAWFLVEPGVEVTIEDLTFDGDGRQVYQAFRVRGMGRFEGLAFRDVQFGTYQGTAIAAFGGPVDVVDSSFEQIGRIGVFFFGAGVAGSTAAGVEYTGKGDGDFLDYGVEIGAGAVAEVVASTFTDCRGVAVDSSQSAGVLVSTFFGPGTVATLEGSQMLANTHGIVGGPDPDTSEISARFNRLVGNGDAGLTATSSTPAVAEDNWWGCNDGPGAGGCDLVGGAGSADTDPWLQLSFAVVPPVLAVGDDAQMTASLRVNSDAADTSGAGTVIDGIPVAFSPAALGLVDPLAAATSAGLASATLTAQAGGLEILTTTVDNETVAFEVTITPELPAVEVPALRGAAMLGLTALLLALGLARLRLAGARTDRLSNRRGE